MTHDDLIAELIDHRERFPGDEGARMLGVSRSHLAGVISGRKMRPVKAKPDPILTALGLRRVVRYEPVERDT